MLLKYIYNIFNLCYNFYGDIMKKILVTIFILLFFSLSVYAEGVTLPILLYHNITDFDQGFDYDVHISREKFTEQLEFLKENNFNTITFKDYYEYRTNGTPLPENPIIITFDDGYYSNYKIAYPILKNMGMKGTIFTVTFSSYIPKTFVFNHFTWAEAREMAESQVIDIESHSANHLVHTNLSYDQCVFESRKSYFDIYKNIGIKPFCYAYPTGAFTELSKKASEDAGYKIQCTVMGKLNNDLTPLNELRRLNIRGDIELDEFIDLIYNSSY